jgi:hypothetical protein
MSPMLSVAVAANEENFSGKGNYQSRPQLNKFSFFPIQILGYSPPKLMLFFVKLCNWTQTFVYEIP